MRTKKQRWMDTGRHGARHIALPHVVVDSMAFRSLNFGARALLIDIARQYNSYNNGKLLACMKYLRPLGWNSVDTVTRAKKELLKQELLFETRKGAYPNQASWYALAWHSLDQKTGIDIDPAPFEKYRGGYLRTLVPIVGSSKQHIAPTIGMTT